MGIWENISRLNDKYYAETVKSRPVDFKVMGWSWKVKKSVNVMPSKY